MKTRALICRIGVYRRSSAAWILCFWCFAAFGRPLTFDDIPRGVQRELAREDVTRDAFPALLDRIRRSTAEREEQGENDHMIFYALQSRRFTSLAPIEPALSAKAFVEAMPLARRNCYLAAECDALNSPLPPDAERRLREFAAALRYPGRGDERLEWFRKSRRLEAATIFHEYARSMRFLYRKEFQKERAQTLYQARGHSTDTAIAANYTVWQALSVLHAMRPSFRAQRVLIVGPGLDFAPRTAFDESAAPQSYQPFAVLDALRSLGMGEPAVHCFDINDRVVAFFQNVRVLRIHSEQGDAEYRRYFAQLGRAIGETKEQGWTKTITLRPGFSVTAEKLNILTDRAARGYDLVVATNVLLYFNRTELLLALGNISGLMNPGAIFLHNDLRPEMDIYTNAAELTPLAARTVRFSNSEYDSFALYTK